MIWNAALDHQLSKHVENILIIQTSLHLDRQAFTGELIDDREHAELAIIACPVLNEVISPDVIAMLWPQANARAVIKPQPPAFRLFYRYFQALAPPDPRNAFVVHMPAIRSEQRRNPLVAIASIAGRQLDDGEGQRILIVGTHRLAPLRRAMLLQQTAGPAFRDAEPAAGMFNELTLARGPYQFPSAASFKIALSSSASASSRFNLAFSFSRSFSFFACSTFIPPYS